MHRFQNCFRFCIYDLRSTRVTRLRRNSLTKTVLKSVHFLKILEISNSHLDNMQKKWVHSTKTCKLQSPNVFVFLKIDPHIFRVLGPSVCFLPPKTLFFSIVRVRLCRAQILDLEEKSLPSYSEK